MGWSCRFEAGMVMDAWAAKCFIETKTSNNYKVGKSTYFWEISRTEHPDGAVTGTIWKEVPPPADATPGSFYAKRAGTFRVEGDGTVTRGPAVLKEIAKGVARED